MKISYYTPLQDSYIDITRGYGNANRSIVTTLNKVGHEVTYNDPAASVQISFCNPLQYQFHPGQYKIGYTPWESTELPPGWVESMNQCDEVWATSPWTAQVYENAGIKPPVYVYEHGIDPLWTPRKRERTDVLRFLHVGEPALRKGGQMAVDAFRAVFGDRADVHLTIKAWEAHWLRAYSSTGRLINPDEAYSNVSISTKSISPAALAQMFYDHDVLVYPSYGEGFGFIPLQGLASGMPVISTYDWAPYARFLQPDLKVSARQDRSIWSLHSGDVFYPNYKDLKYSMKTVEQYYDRFATVAYQTAPEIIRRFDWEKQTKYVFESLEKRITGN